MGDISKRLSRWEFECKCKQCGFAAVDIHLVSLLEEIADYFDRLTNASRIYIVINSACRCREHNEEAQKKADKNYKPYTSRSRHMFGMAVDFWLLMERYRTRKKIDPSLVADYIENKYSNKFGLGRYTTFTHLDVGPRRRW